ncbi:MAG: hypothetical protein MJ217_01220 [Bacilli bacterium]|nr:hypothetical protein [Bacilli bacterium]
MKKIFGLIALMIPMFFGTMATKSGGFAGNFNNAIVVKAEEEYTKEDFLNEWKEIVRKSDDFDPCGENGVTRSQYNNLKNHFAMLSSEDQDYILALMDGNTGNTIKQTFATLDAMFASNKPSSRGSGEISESAAVGIILSVSIVGMTTICIFYALKTKEIID